MAEAAVLGMIQDLESMHVPRTDVIGNFITMKKIVILKDMLYFLRRLKLEERSRLKYFIADLVELAQDIMGINDYHTIAHEKLFDEIDVIKMRMINFGADEKYIGDQREEEEEEEEVVGLEENVKQLLDKAILKKSNHLQIFSIKGMIGIGKTTLARQLYKAGASHFQRHAWVCISSDTSNKEILMKLIQQMVVGYERDPSLVEMDNRSLQRMLCQHLQDMSYFIVLDNIPKEMGLKSILQGLPSRGLTGGRLLLTTRYALRRDDVDYTQEMNALDSDKSWQLFLKIVDKITSIENKFSKELERKGRDMLKKCGGLPIAIIDVARQKATQRLSGFEWKVLFDSIDLSESLKLLEPMYHQLEVQLKPHFLHLSFFKVNAIMREEKLEQIWATNGLDIEKVPEGLGLAANQFDNKKVTWWLARRSILEVVKQHFGKKKCRLHPLLHMISIKKAEEEMGLEILRCNGNSRPSQNARHLVIHCGRDKFNQSTDENSKQIISLVFHGGGGYLEDTSSSYWESFELLKILDMEDFGVKTLSEKIGALIELRYLGLRNNYIQEIPHLLGGLKNLEVFDIAQNFMVEVPDIIWEMDSLCVLHMSNVIFRKPLKVGALWSLMTLTYISIYDLTYGFPSSKKMFKFRTLGIEEVDENLNVGNLFELLAYFPNLDSLLVRGFRYRSMPSLDEIGVIQGLTVLKLDGRIGRLPNADNLPQEIEYIALINTFLDVDPMPILEKLSFLSHLKLRNAYTGREMVIQQGGFRVLKVLCISELWNLRKIQVDEDAMWILRKLEINNCPHLETLPERIRSMPELQKFKMVTTKYIATKMRNLGLTSEIIEEDIYP